MPRAPHRKTSIDYFDWEAKRMRYFLKLNVARHGAQDGMK
jgi:hypothetical protein